VPYHPTPQTNAQKSAVPIDLASIRPLPDNALNTKNIEKYSKLKISPKMHYA